MKNKSHDRSPDKRGFSVALPINLIEDLENIARSETRSRNKQIEKFLAECVTMYHESKRKKPPAPMPRINQRTA